VGSVIALVVAFASIQGTAANGATSSSAVRGVTNNQIILGGVAQLTSPAGPPFPGGFQGAEAVVARVNRQGGINGRKIKFVGAIDDGSDPQKNLSIVKNLVLSDHVFAVVPVISEVFLPEASDFLKAQKVPFFGWGFQPGFCGNQYGYGFNGCLEGTTSANTSLIAPLHKLLPNAKTVAVIAQNVSGSADSTKAYVASAKSEGLDVVYAKNVMPATTVTDYTPYATPLMTADAGKPPQIIVCSSSFPQPAGLYAALKGLGFKGAFISNGSYIPGILAQSPQVAQSLDGSYVDIQMTPQEQGGPAVKQMQADLKAIGASTNITLGVASAYWSTDMAIQQLKSVGRNLTPATFQAKMNSGVTVKPSVSGIGATTWPLDHSVAVPCAALVKVVGTQYKSVEPMACYKNIPLK
jgi:ABC-type branched-subunit amino acid transport system substrate-binding protein